MKDFEISGYHIRLDLGAMRLMAEVTGKDATDPMQGMTDNIQVLATIMYGGMARKNVRESLPVKYTYDEVVALLDDFSQGELTEIIQAWNLSKEVITEKKRPEAGS